MAEATGTAVAETAAAMPMQMRVLVRKALSFGRCAGPAGRIAVLPG